MKASPYPKNNVEVAQDFFDDTYDLVIRFDSTFEQFAAVKTRRFKCFNDLRSAYECILKAIVAYRQPRDMERKALITAVEKHKHNISSLEKSILSVEGERFGVEARGERLDQLPIGLRYTLDGRDFREAKEQLYYETIGSDFWLGRLRDYIAGVRDAVGTELAKHGGIVSAGDIPMEKILGTEYSKFRK